MNSTCSRPRRVHASGAQPANGARDAAATEVLEYRRFRVALNYGYYWSDIRFSGVGDAHIAMHSVGATFEARPVPAWTIQLSGGASFGGQLTALDIPHTVLPGGLFSVATAYRIGDGAGWAPFVVGSVSFSASFASTVDPTGAERAGLSSLDVRASLVLGKTFFDVWTPYLVARAFGGPIYWSVMGNQQTGTDWYHYQFGLGTVFTIAGRVDLYAECVPFGERRCAGGAGISF